MPLSPDDLQPGGASFLTAGTHLVVSYYDDPLRDQRFIRASEPFCALLGAVCVERGVTLTWHLEEPCAPPLVTDIEHLRRTFEGLATLLDVPWDPACTITPLLDAALARLQEVAAQTAAQKGAL